MPTLVDTNVLLRLLQPHHSQYNLSVNALAGLRQQNADLCVARQNLVEFWVVATRPLDMNGLGMPPATAAGEIHGLHRLFRVLEGKPGTAAAWEKLVARHQISGKQAHDAHLVAVMEIHAVTDILTFNAAHFRRFAGITVIDPAQV